MSIDEETIFKLFEVKKNQLKMMHKRGYDISAEEGLLYFNVKRFKDTYIPFAKQEKKTFRGALTNIYSNDKGDKIMVYYADVPIKSTQLGTNEVNDFIKFMDSQKIKNGIIITRKQLTSHAHKKISELLIYNIQIFLEEEMAFDPTEHYLTPEHIPLTPEQQTKFLISNNLNIDQLPIILTTDIMVRYYDARPGQVIKINRINLYDTLVPKSICYRVVKEP